MSPGSMDTATGELLTASLRGLFAAPASADDLGARLADLGWDEVLAADPAWATTLLFTEQGRALAGSRALDDVVLAALSPVLPPAAHARAVLHPHPSGGAELSAAEGPLRGLLLAPVDGDTEVVVPVATGDGAALLTLPSAPVASRATPAGGFDPASGWLLVEGVHAPSDARALPAGAAWQDALSAGRRALSAEILGVCAAALAMAVRHTSARVQYGRPIASFQAVRHRLSEAHVAVTGARAVLDAAWQVAERSDAGWAATLAKVRAGRAQAECMRAAVQVLGATGLTQESEMHRFVTRAAALDALLGSRQQLTERIGTDLLAGAAMAPVAGI
ncbi:MAG: putative Acyl-CoA dehydrogenase, short-chain specific [Frankiales bacterium]|nr:putative Acyl-CoA dehydrogenase, short-chain specific [Frankiales bacterium]